MLRREKVVHLATFTASQTMTCFQTLWKRIYSFREIKLTTCLAVLTQCQKIWRQFFWICLQEHSRSSEMTLVDSSSSHTILYSTNCSYLSYLLTYCIWHRLQDVLMPAAT